MSQPAHRPRIVVVGSSNTDLVIQCEALPCPGQTVLGGEFARYAGGKGANQAVAAARAGARVSFVGARGDDDFGRAAAAGLKREGVDVRHFRIQRGDPSGVALILVGGRQRENLIAVARSANGAVTPQDVRRAEPVIGAAAAVVAQLEIPLETVVAAARTASRHGVPFILNPAPCCHLPTALLRLVHTLVPNEHEAAEHSGYRDPDEAAGALLAKGCKHVVVTLGSRGAWLADADYRERIPAPKVKPVDTVGAGDCFTAWLAVGVAEGLAMPQAVARATRAAAIAVTRNGAQPGMPWRREVKPG
jgi:ribokinase